MIHLFLKMARQVDEAGNFVFVQLTDHEPGICDERHPDCARQDKIVWLGKEFLMRRRSLDPG